MARPHALRLSLRAPRAQSRGAAVAMAVCLTAATARAQERTPKVTLVPAASTRWDVAAHVTWLGERRPVESFEWDRWLGVASGGGSGGYVWDTARQTDLESA